MRLVISPRPCCPTCGQPLPDLTPLQQEIRGLLAQDVPRAEVVRRLGCSATLVAREAQRMGGPARRGRPKKGTGERGR